MESPEKIDLSDAQREAVTTVGRNVCVSAGAGSGKTRVLVERFIYLVKEKGISPPEILAITFTEKAANEMKRRIVKRLSEEKLEAARREVENAAIGTIHAFCARILREHPLEAGVDPHFVILESVEAEALQEKVLDETIEKLVADSNSGIFELMRIYGKEKGGGENKIRNGILSVFRRSRNSDRPFEEVLRQRTAADRASFEEKLREAVQKIAGAKGADEITRSLPVFLTVKEWTFEKIESLLALKKCVRAAGRQVEAIREFKETLEDFASSLFEEISLPVREIFVRLALEFEKAYEAAKREERALDFDDLQIHAVRLLGGENAVSKHLKKIYQEKFREILVDEYQDTNPLQDRLLELIKREANLFVVGDLKQSIFAFRGTRVELFVQREKTCAQNELGRRVPLSENHRSSPGLIRFINAFFEKLWQEDSLPFEKLEARNPEEKKGAPVEWLALEEGEEETIDDIRIREARSLAQRILSLVLEEGYAYKDIACLFDALKPSFFYEQEFRRAGIPYYVVSSRDFYAQPETRDVLSFLSALENPKQDVPLAAVLRSPLFQISDDTLFWLARRAKAKNKETPLWEGLNGFESVEEIPGAEKEKLRFFRETFQHFLEEKEKLQISELIEKLFRLTDYDLYVLKLRHGERRYANLRKLVEMAREMESKKPLHLGDFVRAVRGMETREVRESQAQVEAEAGNVVRLMSIHLAKGLEFPVVILPDLGGGERSEGGPFLVSQEEGLGLKVWNEDASRFEETLTYRRNKRRSDQLASEESKRKLYVAMTRAEEKIILAGPHRVATPEKTSFHEIATWAEWVERVLREGEWGVKRLAEAPYEPFPFEKRKALAERRSFRTRLESLRPIRLREEPPLVEKILENITFPQKLEFQRIDLPVSAFLLFAKDPEAYFSTYELGVPAEWAGAGPEIKTEEPTEEEEALSRAEFGTRVHQVLEQAVIRHLGAGELEALVQRFNQELTEKEKQEIFELVRRFRKSPTAADIWQSRSAHPELPFVLRLPYGLIHGTLDLIYQNSKGEWVILDYKTSEVSEAGLRDRGEEYRVQMELYALAVWQVLGRLPSEAVLSFLRPGLTYRIPFQTQDAEKLEEKFSEFQREILRFRKDRITGIFPGRS